MDDIFDFDNNVDVDIDDNKDVKPDVDNKDKKTQGKKVDTDDIKATINNVSGFFNALNGVPSNEPAPKPQPKPQPAFVSPDTANSEIEALKAEIEQLKGVIGSYAPMINAINSNPEVRNGIAQMLGSNSPAQPKDVFSQIGIDKDEFIFDADEAIKNPESDSGKVFNYMLANTVYNVVNDIVDKRDRERDISEQKKSVAKELGLTKDDMAKIEDYMNKKKLSFKDVATLYLVETGKFSKKLKNAVQNDVIDQIKTVHNQPGSVVSRNSDGNLDKPIEEQIVDLFNATEGKSIFL